MPGVPVLSAAGTEEREAPVPVALDQLSLYTAPDQNHSFISPEPGRVEETVGAARRSVEPYLLLCQGVYSKIKPRVQRGLQLGSDTITFLQDPPKDFYPKAGVIGFTGILGLFLARGSRVKKLLYPAGLLALSSSLYYPETAARAARTAGDRAYSGAVQSYAAVEKLLRPQPKKLPDSQNKP